MIECRDRYYATTSHQYRALSQHLTHQTHHNPGIMTKRFGRYFGPDSLRYRLSFFLAQTPICAVATPIKTAVPHDRLTMSMANQAATSNI